MSEPRKGAWGLASLFLLALLALTFHEGLLGTAAIDGASRLPFECSLYMPPPAGVAPPLLYNDTTPEYYHQPGDRFAMAVLRSGHLPLWNAHNGLGVPYMANGQAAPLNPFKLACLLFTDAGGVPLAWFLVSRLAWAGLGMVWLARALGQGPWGAALAAAAWALNGFFIYHFHMPDVTSYAWLPWLFLAGLRLAEAPTLRRVAVFGLAIGLTGTSGHPEGALFAAGAAWCVALGQGGTGWARRGAAFVLAGAWGGLLAAFTVLPFLEMVRGSTSYMLTGHHAAPAWAERLGTFLVTERTYMRHLFFTEHSATAYDYNPWIGMVALGLAPLGLGASRSRAIALATLALAFGLMLVVPTTCLFDVMPIGPNAFYLPPLVAFALALLAGAGLDRVLARPRDRAVAAMAGVALAIPALVLFELHHHPDVYAGMAWSWQSAAFGLVVAGLLACARWLPTRALGGALVLGASLELLLGARVGIPRLPCFDYPQTPFIQALLRQPAGYRFAGLFPDLNLAYGLDGIALEEAFFPKRYWAFMQALNGVPETLTTTIDLKPTFQPDLLDLANVRYIVSPPMPAPAASRFRPIFQGPFQTLYENETVLPRAWVAHAADFVRQDDPAAVRRLAATPARWHTHVLVETPSGSALPGWHDGLAAPGAASVSTPAPNMLAVEARADQPGILVVSEAYDPDWQATLDGQPVPTYPADVALRAVWLPAGRHHVAFTYAPASVRAGFMASGLALLAALVALGWRRPAARPDPAPTAG